MANPGEGLTAEQRALARTVSQEWVGHGLTLRPADRATAEAGVRLVYREAGLPPPRRVVWAGSPLAGVIAALAWTARADLGLHAAGRMWDELWARLSSETGMREPDWARLGPDQVGAPVWSGLRDSIWDAWWAAWAQVGEPLWEEAAALAAPVDARVGAVGEAIWEEVDGQLAEAGVDWRVGEEVRRHLSQPGQDWGWEWGHEIWPRLLAKVARRAWLPPWELVVAPPRAGGGDATELWWSEEIQGGEPSASPGQVGELSRQPSKEQEDWDDWYDASGHLEIAEGPFEEEVRSGWYSRGQHDAGALALVDVLDRAVGLRILQSLRGQLLIGRSAGWWWPFEHAVILAERPCALDLARDEQGRLHHPTGPVVAYPDGWAAWAWHGVRVPRQVIERPDTITVEQIHATRNVEVRWVLLERYGLARYLRDSEAALVDVDDYGKLWHRDLPGGEPLVMVEVVNASPEPDGSYATYLLRVPPDVDTAKEAVAWTFGMDEAEYHPSVQT